MPGRLIVLEGAEGVGKTTQLRRLEETLRAAGHDVVAVREPGGTPLGDAIRRLLLDPASDIDSAAEALLFMVSRAQLVQRVIRPALARGAVVLVDRFFLSTYAYQVHGRGLALDDVRHANRLAVGDLVPDLTLLLVLPAGEGLARAAARGDADRMEASGDDFHGRVAAAFGEFARPAWQSAHPECGPVTAIDATGTVEAVATRIATAVQHRWPESFAAGLESNSFAAPAPRSAVRDAG